MYEDWVGNKHLFIRRNPSAIRASFTMCSHSGCTTTSGIADYKAMTIRTGFSTCTDHITKAEVESRINGIHSVDDKTLIFYDIELSRDGEIEQIGACTEAGESFSALVRTSVRTNTSPFLKTISPKYYSLVPDEPGDVMRRLIIWINAQNSKNQHSNGDPNNVILAAHNGSCHDHVYLLRTMMKWNVNPPGYMLSDTLAIFKTLRGKYENAKLTTLAARFAPWIVHTPHDADSDAEVLRYVTMMAFPNTKMTCLAFSIQCADFMVRIGLNLYMTMPTDVFGVVDDDRHRRNSTYGSVLSTPDSDKSTYQ